MKLTTALALAALAPPGGVGWTPAVAQRPDLSGHWTFNATQSDDPRDMLPLRDTAGSGSSGTRGGGRRGGFGGGFGGRRGGFGGGGGDIELKGHWQGNDFIVERKVSGGGTVTENYLRSQDGKQRFVIVSLDTGRGRSIEFRRVYDAAGAPSD